MFVQPIKTNPNLKFLRDNFDKSRIIKLEGGMRSGKTYSVLQFIVEQCFKYQNANVTYSICRVSNPVLKATVVKDLINILTSEGIYNEAHHNKTEQTYRLFGNTIDYFSLDTEDKVKGRERDVLYVNEADCTFDIYKQLATRTKHKIIVDLNPWHEVHWAYNLDARPDCKSLTTTFLDNPHLPKSQVEEIMDLKNTDPEAWDVYGLGLRGKGLKGRVYKHFQPIETIPDITNKIYGLDFGFSNDPTALVEMQYHNRRIYIKELIYEPGLTNDDIYLKCKQMGITGSIYADNSEGKSIEELHRLGLNIKPCVKGPGSINAGISFIKQCQVFYKSDSLNIERELRFYIYRVDKEGKATNEPIDKYNHLCDAIRYGLTPYMQLKGKMTGTNAPDRYKKVL